ncbi:MAG: type IV pilus secretin PilQ [Vicinamibacteria bacterium]|nr:type IV pilus secretin PilQ [Vicinamibacteria bacterium]
MRGKLAGALLTSALLLAAAAPAALAQEGAAAVLSDIRQEAGESATRLVLECSAPVAYTYYSPDPLTLVVDLPELDASKMPSRIAVGSREVESVRVASMVRGDGRTLARVEVRLASLVPYQIFSRDRSLHLLFERAAESAGAAPAAAETAATELASADPVPAAPAASEAAVAEAVASEPPAPEPVEAPVIIASGRPQADLGGARATRILGVSTAEEDGGLAVTVRADGRLGYQDFFLGNPDRLVVDFPGVTSRVPVRPVEVGVEPVRKARVAQFSAGEPKVARLVLDLAARAPYRIVEANDGLKIVFGGPGRAAAPEPLAAIRPATSAAVVPAPVAAPPAPAVVAPAYVHAVPENTPLPENEPKKFTGHPINLDFKDGDLVDIFRLFADISGLNVVINPGVSGKVSLKLVEVPWDQALDLILKTNGLGMNIEDNVIRIARLADLQREQNERRKLDEEKGLAGPLATRRWRLAYAKGTELEPTIKKIALSPRGNITMDARTQTMIVTDLEDRLEKVRELIADLDRPTPQVEIEARIVVTTRNFTRDIGVQWGFNHEQSTRFGNSTGLVFPNSLVINGTSAQATQGIPADQNGQAALAGIGNQAPAGRGYAVNLPANGSTAGIGVSMGNILGNFSLDAALTALERQGRVRILSTPRIATQNNMSANIKQGTQIPYQTTANNTITTSFKDATLTLDVTPQITNAGTVQLKVLVENNSPGDVVGGVTAINTQSATTNLLVRDGATAVIGGIYQNQESNNVNSVPFFSKIPVLGYLFRNKAVTTQNAELVIFITPRILKD